VVEDEFLIASVLCDLLEDASAIVVGPARTVAEALHLLKDEVVEGALVDMNLNGQWSDPIAEELQFRRIPFVFTTGYGFNERTERFGARVVGKPYSWDEVEHQLTLSIQEAAQLPTREPT
jgi:response regulator RpfG family c-di-GMP phosphodiesterase